MAKVDVKLDGDVAILTLSNPPVNALAHGIRSGLLQAISDAGANPAVKAVVITGEGRAFSAGADIAEFKSGLKEPGLGTVIDAVEASGKPVVAAINGLALGGGLEVALGCHYRVAAKTVGQLGLPEVKIGILPGAGGTQRLPRLIGVEAALDMIVSGNPVSAPAAVKAGLVDRTVDGDVVAASIAYARELVAAGKGPRPTSASMIDPAIAPAALFDKRRAALARHPSGPMAGKNCIAAVEAAVGSDYVTGARREWELFRELAASPYAKALQYAFFAERKAADIPDIGAEIRPRDVKSVGVVGAGTMGTGISLAFLNAGLPVTIFRPSMVVGSTRDGATRDFNVIYPLLRIMSSGYVSRFPARADALVHIAPIDFVAGAILKAIDEDWTTGKTFHLTAPAPPRVSDLLDSREFFPFGTPRPTLVDANEFDMNGVTAREREVLESIAFSFPYFNSRLEFDTTNTARLVELPVTDAAFIDRLGRYALESGYLRHQMVAA